ncbi:MAG: ATP-binding cassette domain-containing protein [Bacteroidales bacterium]|nr:ATP-binding cassette domain-containing protein [Bacteroidales bacterium]
MQPSIQVRDVIKTYGSQKALDMVSLDVFPGGVVGLLGPNGAGKSTLMKIITSFIPPTSGEVKVLGFNIFGQDREIRRRVGYLPESNPLYTDMYVKEYLQFIAGVHKLSDPRRRVSEMIEITGLGREQHKRIHALSKGYRQRVGIAQALIHDPQVLILDEPTSGLDPNQLAEVRNLIRETGKSRTVMLSTHIMQEVEAVCERVIIIDKGRIVADDRTDRLSGLLAGKTVLEVEFNTLPDLSRLRAIPGVQLVNVLHDSVVEIHTSATRDVREAVFNLAVAESVKVLSMKKIEQKLEDVFQALTSGV